MSLNTPATALSIANSYTDLKAPDAYAPGFMNTIAPYLDNGFQQGVISPGGVDITVVANTLVLTTPYNLGIDIATYWEAAIGLGTAIYCSNVKSVSNDAAKIADPIMQDLYALGGDFTYEVKEYENFVNVIYNHVKTIIWSVSEETVNTCNKSYTATIS